MYLNNNTILSNKSRLIRVYICMFELYLIIKFQSRILHDWLKLYLWSFFSIYIFHYYKQIIVIYVRAYLNNKLFEITKIVSNYFLYVI